MSSTRCAKIMSITKILCSAPSAIRSAKTAKISKRSTSPSRSRRPLELANLVERFNTFLENDYLAKSTKKDVVRMALVNCFQALSSSTFSMTSLRNTLPCLDQQNIALETGDIKEKERNDDVTIAFEKLQISTFNIGRCKLVDQMTNLRI